MYHIFMIYPSTGEWTFIHACREERLASYLVNFGARQGIVCEYIGW